MMILESLDGLTCLHLHYPAIQFEEGSCTFLSGKSGCGKSTYLKLLNATMLPSDKAILYRGRQIKELDIISYRRKVMLVPQDVFLYDLSIEENFHLYYSNREESPLSKERMTKALALCCANFPLDMPCSKLSGGERQRVFIAIFLSFHPDVLLLDEPTSALDALTAGQLLSRLTQYCHEQGITMVAVCHQEELAQAYGDQIIRLGEAQ